MSEHITLEGASGASILVIEDSRLLRKALERILAKAGYSVLTADEGRIGLEIAKNRRPAAILLDLLLPVMGGIEVLRSLKKDAETKDIPVLVLSGMSQQNSKKLEKDGATAYIEKTQEIFTTDSATLLTALRDLLHPEARREEGARKIEQAAQSSRQ
jgi:CheY-like chemotaxis protein